MDEQNDFIEKIEGGFKPLPVEKKEAEKSAYEDWKDQTNNHPKVVENNDQIYDKRWHNFLVFFFIGIMVAGLTMGIVFLVLVNDGKFQTIIDQEIKPFFNQTTFNEFKNTFNQDIQLDPTINVDVIIEEVKVSCDEGGCVSDI